MRILFVTSNRVGDAILSTGLLDHLIRVHPRARITVVCGRVAEGVFTRMPNLDRIILLDKRPYGRHWLTLWRQVCLTRWDLVVDMRGTALSWLVPTRRRAVWHRLSREAHKTVENAAVLGLDPPPLPVTWTAAADHAVAARLLPAGRTLVAIGPTANWAPKTWAPTEFADLFHELSTGPLPGAVAVVFAGSGAMEAAMAAPLLAALPAAIDLCGKLSLPEAAACLERCSLYIGNDSGLMHLAAATGIPTLGLFGPTSAAEYAPAGRRAAVVRSADGTMAGLDTNEVLAAATRLVELVAS